MQMQTVWKAAITPVIGNQINQGLLLLDVTLKDGATPINHLLGRTLVGWEIVDIDADASIYRSQPKNAQTLTLTSNMACVVSLWVF
jgi:uncharacterized membrane-anchored protein